MFYIESKALPPPSPDVRRDIDVQRILTENVKSFNYCKEKIEPGYVEFGTAISVRSMYDNTVLAYHYGDITSYHRREVFVGYALPHRGLDLLMYMSSLALIDSVVYTKDVDRIMFQHSQFQPIGLYYPDKTCTPLFYSHLILSDQGMKLLEPHLKPEVTVVPIQYIPHQGYPSALRETLIIVKEELHE